MKELEDAVRFLKSHGATCSEVAMTRKAYDAIMAEDEAERNRLAKSMKRNGCHVLLVEGERVEIDSIVKAQKSKK